jgi:hypothetical protein
MGSSVWAARPGRIHGALASGFEVGYRRRDMPRKSTTVRPLERVRAIIARLPETSEKLSHGSPTFWGGRKTFASFHDNHHGDGRIAIWCKSSFDAQQALTEADPNVFFVPPYVGPSGWLGIRLDRALDWAVVEELLLEGYSMVAPAKAR